MHTPFAIILLFALFTYQGGRIAAYIQCRLTTISNSQPCDCEKILASDDHNVVKQIPATASLPAYEFEGSLSLQVMLSFNAANTCARSIPHIISGYPGPLIKPPLSNMLSFA
jgi:hypothetical protein